MIDIHDKESLLNGSCIISKEEEYVHPALLFETPSQSKISLATTGAYNTINIKSSYGLPDEESCLFLDQLKQENAKLPPQDSTAFILAQVERQNVLLERDPKSIRIHSNKLKSHFSTVQKLVHGNMDDVEEEIDWGFWEVVIQDSDQVALKLPHLFSLKLKSGIPSKIRGLMWQTMSKSASLHLETVYKQLCSERSPHEKIIERDLSRTFPRIDMFKQQNGQGQSALKRILEAYSLYDIEVGYCQGLAFLVGPLLINMPEEQSFCVFVRLMETYGMRSMFTSNMEGLQVRLYQFHTLLKEIVPSLASHFDNLNIHPAMYVSQWFLTLFAYAFPMSLVERIYDIVFAEGAAETIMRVAIAMLKRSQEILLNQIPAEFEHTLDYVTSQRICEPYKDDHSQIIHDAMGLSNIITREKMNQLGKEYTYKATNEHVEFIPSRFSFWRLRRQPDQAKQAKYSRNNVPKVSTLSKPQSKELVIKQPSLFKKHCSSTFSNKDWSSVQKTAINENQKEDNPLEDKLKMALCELENLKTEHRQALSELNEARCDKEDLMCERDALKLTIAELERCRQASLHASKSTTSCSNLGINNNDSPLQVVQNEAKEGSTFIKIEGSRALSSQIIHTEARESDSERQYQKLLQDLNAVQAKLDLVYEGQVNLVAELVAMKTQLEEAKVQKSNNIKDDLHLKHYISQMNAEEIRYEEQHEMCPPRRHSTTSLLPSATHAQQLYRWETFLKASRLRLAEYELLQNDV